MTLEWVLASCVAELAIACKPCMCRLRRETLKADATSRLAGSNPVTTSETF